ncbi:3796_t:CDS:2 [Scutellospora calospora]|uniref:3796_t:CDS:1 n=1 Tax=Scutellospora calospora TaxID=85575 RepID=A0ACA9M7L4_9GLOM|nr:3796_t:CDS:2 [Scutellospora calospora]
MSGNKINVDNKKLEDQSESEDAKNVVEIKECTRRTTKKLNTYRRTKRRQKPSKEDVENESNSGLKAIIAENG